MESLLTNKLVLQHIIYLPNILHDEVLTSGTDVGLSLYNTEVFTDGLEVIIWG